MKVCSEYFTNEKAVFIRVDAFLKNNCLYDIVKLGTRFILYYTFSENCRIAYTVLKGRNNEAFKFTLGQKSESQNEIYLVKGDVLYFYYQRTKKTFFYCPKALIGKHEFKMEASIGFTNYGKKTAMLEEGLIKSCLSCNIGTYFSNLIHNYECDGVTYRQAWSNQQCDDTF